MKFAHISDSHLSFRQFGLLEREYDFYDVFDKVIDSIIKEKPDFVIHSGDFFESSRPSPLALLSAQMALSRLKNNDIPIFAIAGNHDIVMRSDAIPPQMLFEDLGLTLLDPSDPYIFDDKIFIGGIQYYSRHFNKLLLKSLENLENKAKDYDKKILVLHQGIDRYLNINYELKMGQIPKNFNYYAFGHIHKRIIEDFGEGKLAYPGCPEIWRMDEIENYETKGKGYYMVDISRDSPEIKLIDIESPRAIIQRTIDYSNFDKEIDNLKEEVDDCAEKPLLKLKIVGDGFKSSDIHPLINEIFNKNCLSTRIQCQPNIINEKLKTADNKHHNIQELLKEGLDYYKEDYSEFALELLNSISKNDLETAESLTKKLYGDFKC
ncbi:metallophosphoesterase family protein [Methanobacterium sp. MBAC-LM]|uniref:metallophosphoesterase family protein n=1 Tax=Methanobacterium sp. MBAC-LM TaxID=3412034 RepID=UPI003C74BDE4